MRGIADSTACPLCGDAWHEDRRDAADPGALRQCVPGSKGLFFVGPGESQNLEPEACEKNRERGKGASGTLLKEALLLASIAHARAAAALPLAMSTAVTSLALSAAERDELQRDPQAFARRAEAVLSAVLQKLSRLEAERSAERIDSEQQFHQLERSHATLRQEHERAIAQYDKMSAERSTIVEARTAAAAESARLLNELREQKAENARNKDTEREGAEDRRRLLEINERKSRQLEAAEKELSDTHASLTHAKCAPCHLDSPQSPVRLFHALEVPCEPRVPPSHALWHPRTPTVHRSVSAELERRVSEAESSALTAKLQLSSQVAELASTRLDWPRLDSTRLDSPRLAST